MLGVALIGLGEIGQIHAQGIQECSSAHLAIVCDTDPAQLDWATSELGVRTTSRLEEALERSDVDVVSVCLPHNLHFPVAQAALNAGKHVLIEKPMATTVEECDALIATAAEKRVVLGVSHNRLFVPSNIRAREMIDAGEIGEPLLLRQRLGMAEPFGGWRLDPQKSGGGLLSDSGAHQLYVARYLFGEIEGLRSFLDVPHDEGESLAIVWMEFASGANGVFEANYWGPSGMFDDSVEIIGSQGVLRLAGLEATTFKYMAETPMQRYSDGVWSTVDVEFIRYERTVMLSVMAFLDAVAEGRPVPASGEDGRENVRLIQAVYADPILVGKFTRSSMRS